MNTYTLHKTAVKPDLQGQWESGVWQDAPALAIANFHPQSSPHHPTTEAKLLYDDTTIYIIFRVADRYVRAVCTTYQQQVCNDSCVEFFVQPREGKGYFNFEVNCIGTLLLSYIEDPTRIGQTFKKSTPVAAELVRPMTIFHSLSGVIATEMSTPVEWIVEYTLPLSLFEAYLGPLTIQVGTVWKGNFYKCADQTSHPHWASWAPIGKELNFHQPAYFGQLTFGRPLH